MVNAKKIYCNTEEKLKASGIEDAKFEAYCILNDVCKISKNDILSNAEIDLSDEAFDNFKKIIIRRCDGEPLQYLLGMWEFYGLPFYVGEGVLIPRADTETVVEKAISLSFDGCRVADLCSGSGCIAVSMKKNNPDLDVYAIELSDKAFEYLERNIKLNDVDISLLKGNVCDSNILNALPDFDLIISNPPYLTKYDMEHLQREVTFEPKMALYGGDDGLYMYRKITQLWKKKLNANGILIYEIGIGQEKDVARIMLENGFCDIELNKDLNGIIRAVSGTQK